MIGIIILAIIALIFFGVGFAIHILWWLAIIAAIIWLIGFFVRPRRGGRWYYW
ncbi:MAG: hydrophobic protein [Acidimicrobiales bacterium]